MSQAFQPLLTILAGPNGSGKTTLFDRLNPSGEQVNADRIARLINPVSPEAATASAARATLTRLGELIRSRQNFSYETTLAGQQPLTLMAQARAEGYRVELAYITLESVDLNLLRVAQRVREGGHHIATRDIIRRYARSLQNLSAAVGLADEVAVFDNTESTPRLLWQMKDRQVLVSHLDSENPHHSQIAKQVDAMGGRAGAQ